MNYIKYKKNELIKLSLSDISLPYPDLKNINKSEAIVDWIIRWIKQDNISNCLLPTKSELAYALGVSLGTIQNVFKMLEDKGYIFLKQRIGAIVRDVNETKIVRKHTSKTDIAIEEIKKYIVSSSIKVGDKLISSRKLASITGLSLSCVRLSINKLINDGILEFVGDSVVLKNDNINVNEILHSETLVSKIAQDLKKYISSNYNIGEKLPPHGVLAEQFKVSIKTIHNAIKILEKENMLLSRRGTYGTIVVSTSVNSAFEPRREMSIFASAQDTAFYHYEKVQHKIKKIITDNYGIGSKLPSIKEFSENLDLSPNTIRKALNNLASEGILRFARGRYGGTFVIDMPDVEEQTFRWLAVNPRYAQKAN